jgi:hypothetical protein
MPFLMPKDDADGWPIHLELCPACATGKPAAGALLLFLAEGGDRDATRGEEGARPLLEWTKKGMADHGWYWEQSAPGDPQASGAMAPSLSTAARA